MLGGYPLAMWRMDAKQQLSELDPNVWGYPAPAEAHPTVFFGLACTDEEGGVLLIQGRHAFVHAELPFTFTTEGPVAGTPTVRWQGCW